MEDFKLYNMNGRLYDPVLGRFLSADPVVQDPSFTQSLNRYSYCLNNPLKYNDPSGEFWNWPLVWFGNWAIGGLNRWINGKEPFKQAFSPTKNPVILSTNYSPSANQFSHPQIDAFKAAKQEEKVAQQMDAFVASQSGVGGGNPTQQDMILQGEVDGFSRIWNTSFSKRTEYSALITPKGLITFNAGEHGGDLFGGLSPIWKGNNCFVNFNNLNYQVLGSAHVHWDKSRDPDASYWDPRNGAGDQSAAYYTLRGQVPVFVLGWNKKIYSISYTKDFTNFLSNYSVNDLLNGNLSLYQLLQQNR